VFALSGLGGENDVSKVKGAMEQKILRESAVNVLRHLFDTPIVKSSQVLRS